MWTLILRVSVPLWNTYCEQIVNNLRVILTHWGWVPHIWISKLTIIGSDNGLSPGRGQTIIGVCLLAPMCGGKTPRLQWYSSSCIYGDNVQQCSHIHTLHEGNVSMETRKSGLTPMEMAAVRILHQTIGVCLLAPMCGGKTPRLQWYSSSCIYGDNVHQCSHIHTLHEGNVSMETRESGLTPGWLL